MKLASLALAFLIFTGCATIQHPTTGPSVQYASMDQCHSQHLMDSPGDCAKIYHNEATKQAVGVGATLLVVLGYLALIGFVIAGGR